MDLLSVPQDKLRALLAIRSEEELKALLAAYPGVAGYISVVQPLIGALNMLMVADARTSLGERRLSAVREMAPFVSGLIWEDAAGKKSVEMVEIAADALNSVLEFVPERLHGYVPATLQVSLHHPEYLTTQSAEILEAMLADEKLEPGPRERLSRFREVVLACVQHGIDRDLMRAVAAKLRPAAGKEAPSAPKA